MLSVLRFKTLTKQKTFKARMATQVPTIKIIPLVVKVIFISYELPSSTCLIVVFLPLFALPFFQANAIATFNKIVTKTRKMRKLQVKAIFEHSNPRNVTISSGLTDVRSNTSKPLVAIQETRSTRR